MSGENCSRTQHQLFIRRCYGGGISHTLRLVNTTAKEVSHRQFRRHTSSSARLGFYVRHRFPFSPASLPDPKIHRAPCLPAIRSWRWKGVSLRGGVAVDLSALLKPPVHLNIVSRYTPHIAPHVCLKPRGPFCLGTSPVDLKWLWVGVEKRQSPPDRRGTKEVPCLASISMYTPLPSTKPHFSTFALLLNFLFVLLRQPSSAFTLHLPAPPTASLGKYTR